MGRFWIGVAGAAVGVVTALLFDPARGRARRARLTDKAAATMRRAWRGVARQQRMIASTVAGKASAFRVGSTEEAERPNDPTLKDRVESELLGDPKVPKGSININAQQGIVVLRGEVPDARVRARLEKRAAAIHGVWYVENLLHLPGEPAPTAR